MPAEVGLAAILEPELDKQKVEQEAQGLRDKLSMPDLEITPDVDTSGLRDAMPDASDLRQGAGRATGRAIGNRLPTRAGTAVGGAIGVHRWWRRLVSGLNHKAGEIAPARIPDHRYRRRRFGEVPRPGDFDVADLRQPQLAVDADTEPATVQPDRLPMVFPGLESGKADEPPIRSLGGIKEAAVGRVAVAHRLLEHDVRDLGEKGPLGRGLRLGDELALEGATGRVLRPIPVGIPACCHRIVVDQTGAAKGPCEGLALRAVRIQTIAVA